MPRCIIPGCEKEGTCLHNLERPGSAHLLCPGHYDLLFLTGGASEEDLKAYNTTYQGILAERRAAAKPEEPRQ